MNDRLTTAVSAASLRTRSLFEAQQRAFAAHADRKFNRTR